MAILSSSSSSSASSPILVMNKHVTRVLMAHKNQIPCIRKAIPLMKSIRVNKVFEDQSNGIVCYRDDSGEMICEGYDEGPRFHPQASRRKSHPRELQTFNPLQKSQLWMVGVDFLGLKTGIAVQEDQDWTRFKI